MEAELNSIIQSIGSLFSGIKDDEHITVARFQVEENNGDKVTGAE